MLRVAAGAEALFEAGMETYNNSDYEFSMRKFKEVINKFPDDDLVPHAYFQLGKAAEKLNRKQESLEYYKSSVAKSSAGNGVNVRSKFSLAWVYFELKQMDEAIKFFREITFKYQTTPQAVEAQFKLGDIFYIKGEYSNAAKEYSKVSLKIPDQFLGPQGRFLDGKM